MYSSPKLMKNITRSVYMTSTELVSLGELCPRVRLHVLHETETHIQNSLLNSLPVPLLTAIVRV
jgi:hypothetical protein